MAIAENLAGVQAAVRRAARRAGRDPRTVTLVGVAKTHPPERIREALAAGLVDIGESRAQELREKTPLVGSGVRWHFVGHLQKNKVKSLVGDVALIHSVDTVPLAREIALRARAAGRIVPVLLQVNIAGEPTRHGVSPDAAAETLRSVAALPGIRVEGLMTMAPGGGTAEEARWCFRELRELRDRLQAQGDALPVLSMGMSGDFEVAVEEGATHLRVGTAIFGRRREP